MIFESFLLFWWFFGAFQIAGYLYTAWRISGQLFYGLNWSHYDGPGYRYFCSIASASFLALAWWISLPISILSERANKWGTSQLVYVPKDKREELYKERIRELEREVGIR